MGDSFSIRRVRGIPDPPWDDLVRECRSPWQARCFARLQAHFGVETVALLLEREGRLVGGQLLFLPGGRRWKSLDRWFIRTAYIPDEPAVRPGSEGALPRILEALEGEVRASGAVSAFWRVEMNRRLDAAELERRGWSPRPVGAAVLDLPPDPDGIDDLLDRQARKQIRKAERNGVAVEVADGVERLLPLLDRSFERAGLPHRNHEYIRVLHEVAAPEVLVAVRGGADLAALMWWTDGETALNMLHGRADGDTQGSSDLLHRELFRRAVERGARLVHSGDTALPDERDERVLGIGRFKKKMGFRVHPTFEARRVLRPVASRIRDAALKCRAWVRS